MPVGRIFLTIFIIKRKMKKVNHILLIASGICIGGCNNTPTVEESISKLRAMNPQAESSSTANIVPKDTIRQSENIPAPMDSVTYWKMVRDSCPELFRKVPLSPYEAYDKCESGYMIGWGSEVGMDDYFQVYAKVLRKRSNRTSRSIRRETMESLKLLNFITTQLSGGGTFYSHMLSRSEGEIEYSIYRMEHGEIDFSPVELEKERSVLFSKWKKNIHNSLVAKKIDNFNGVSDSDLEKQLLDSLSKMKSYTNTAFTLTYLRGFGRSYSSDLNFE